MIAGPGNNETPGPEATAKSRDHGDLRASHDDREQAIGTLKTAFVQGRLTEEELGVRAGQVYASRTYAELAGITADIPDELTGRTQARSRRDPWRATRIAWRIEYSVFLPGIVTLLVIPGGPGVTAAQVVLAATVAYLLFWVLGIAMMVSSRRPKAAPEDREHLHAAHAVARDQVIRVLGAALAQGRLTEEEHQERSALVPASRCWADLDALIADLPAGLASQLPKARDVKAGACVSAGAASVLAALLLSSPDDLLAFVLALLCLATLVVVPVVTVGLWVDVRHQKKRHQKKRARRRR
ncbi:MAG TPA: DUF1707 domain-containing protein [Streptosporangiaceae bacterium]|nr:DUF1707 domain-containing protein [Streptosporangiaceae bacterium]